MKAKTIRFSQSVQSPGTTVPCGAFHTTTAGINNIPSERILSDIDVGDIFVKLTNKKGEIRFTPTANMIDCIPAEQDKRKEL